MNTYQKDNRNVTVPITLLLALISSCSYVFPGVSGPYSISEITNRLHAANSTLPVYKLDSSFSYPNGILSFYYDNQGFDSRLTTFIFQNEHESRVARMVVSLRPPALDDAMTGSKPVTVLWASNSTAYTCVFTPGTVARDSMAGDPYQTCLVWRSGDYSFLFYSALPLDESVELINSFEKVN